jgi:hypothetical protein
MHIVMTRNNLCVVVKEKMTVSRYIRFEAFTAVTMKNVVIWDVALCRSAHAGSPLADFSTLKMEAIRSSETSVDARSTQHHIPEDDILQCRDMFMNSFYK